MAAVLLLAACLVHAQCSANGTPDDDGGCDCYFPNIGAACDLELQGNNCVFNVTSGEQLFCTNLLPLTCDGAWAVELTVEYSGLGVVAGRWVNYGYDSVDLCTDLQQNSYWAQPGGPSYYPLVEMCLSFTGVTLVDTTTLVANVSLTVSSFSTEIDSYHSLLDSGTLQIGSISGSNAPCGQPGYHYGECSLSWQEEAAVTGSNLYWSAEDNCVYNQGWKAFCPTVYFDPCSSDGYLSSSSGIRFSVPLTGDRIAWYIDCTSDVSSCLTLNSFAANGTEVTYNMTLTLDGESVTYATQYATFPSCGAPQCMPNVTVTPYTYTVDDDGGDDGADDDDQSNPNAGVYLAFLCFFIFLCFGGVVVAGGIVAYRIYMKKKMAIDSGYGILNDGDGTKSLLEEMSDENDASEIPEPDFSF